MIKQIFISITCSALVVLGFILFDWLPLSSELQKVSENFHSQRLVADAPVLEYSYDNPSLQKYEYEVDEKLSSYITETKFLTTMKWVEEFSTELQTHINSLENRLSDFQSNSIQARFSPNKMEDKTKKFDVQQHYEAIYEQFDTQEIDPNFAFSAEEKLKDGLDDNYDVSLNDVKCASTKCRMYLSASSSTEVEKYLDTILMDNLWIKNFDYHLLDSESDSERVTVEMFIEAIDS